ncbi:N-acetylmuramoyl-L-alanine amidase [Flavobacteriaceae bacterium]|nr:N-acetylmuramoyl-L-alanine amidase [Flavobacteriaceae bacterium]MDB4152106.1 N-acetylmuramoyl-L-alanine amidase [Flavobacteriaceae bacterium]
MKSVQHYTLNILLAGFCLLPNHATASIQTDSSQDKPFVVVLDAGHGGKDSGNRGNGYYEKKIALNIILQIGKILEMKPNIKVIYTRKTDVFVDLIERARIANRADADLFISVHCDAHTSQAYGAGTFVLGLHANQRNFEVAKKENSVIFYEENYEENYDGFDPNNPESVIGLTLMQETYLNQSITAADAIQKSFVANLNRKDRTVKQAGFVVLKYTYMPSVLVETGFLTNSKEGAYLNSSKGKLEMAQAISKAIINYKNSLSSSINTLSSIGETVVEEKKEAAATSNEVIFKIQIAASSKKLESKAYNFKGLSPISREKEKELYRYYYSETTSYEKAKKLKKKAKRKGYKHAFIVAFKENKKIKLSTVIPN